MFHTSLFRLIFTALIALASPTGQAANSPAEAIENALFIVRANPKAVYRLWPHGINLVDLVAPVSNLKRTLQLSIPSSGRDLKITGTAMEVTSETDWVWNDRVHPKTAELLLFQLSRLPEFELKGIDRDLSHWIWMATQGALSRTTPHGQPELKAKLERDAGHLKDLNEFQVLLTAYIWMLPFLYDDHGQARFARFDPARADVIRKELEAYTCSQSSPGSGVSLANRYFSTSTQSIYTGQDFSSSLERVKLILNTVPHYSIHGPVERVFKTFEKIKVRLGTERHLKSRRTGLPVNSKSIFLEKIHPLEGLARSAYAADCGTSCLPYYALLNRVHVFKVLTAKARSMNQVRSMGYFVVLETRYQGKSLPYVLAFGGNFVTSDSFKSYLPLISTYFNSDSVLFSDLRNNLRLIDNPDVVGVLNQLPGDSVEVDDFPENWSAIDRYVQSVLPELRVSIGHPDYENVYALDRIRKAKLVTFQHLTGAVTEAVVDPPENFSFSAEYPEVQLKERALLAAQFTLSKFSFDLDEVLFLLQVSKEMHDYALNLLKAASGQKVAEMDLHPATLAFGNAITESLFRRESLAQTTACKKLLE